MASLFQRLRSKISRALGLKPKLPKIPKQAPMGHRGIAAGRLSSYQGEQDAQKVDAQIKVAEELLAEMKADDEPQATINRQIEKIDKLTKRAFKLRNPQRAYSGPEKQVISGDEVADFLHDQQPLFVNSSNLGMLQYFPSEKKLVVEFLKGGVYDVSPISEQEALQFAQTPSKGGTFWDVVRVRGKGNSKKSRKHVVRIR